MSPTNGASHAASILAMFSGASASHGGALGGAGLGGASVEGGSGTGSGQALGLGSGQGLGSAEAFAAAILAAGGLPDDVPTTPPTGVFEGAQVLPHAEVLEGAGTGAGVRPLPGADTEVFGRERLRLNAGTHSTPSSTPAMPGQAVPELAVAGQEATGQESTELQATGQAGLDRSADSDEATPAASQVNPAASQVAPLASQVNPAASQVAPQAAAPQQGEVPAGAGHVAGHAVSSAANPPPVEIAPSLNSGLSSSAAVGTAHSSPTPRSTAPGSPAPGISTPGNSVPASRAPLGQAPRGIVDMSNETTESVLTPADMSSISTDSDALAWMSAKTLPGVVGTLPDLPVESVVHPVPQDNSPALVRQSSPEPAAQPGIVTAGAAAPSSSTPSPEAAQQPPSPAVLWHQVRQQLGAPLARLRSLSDGLHTMTIQLNPEHLGPLRLQAQLTDGHLTLLVQSATESARLLLQQGIPELRADLSSTLARVDVDVTSGFDLSQQPGSSGGGRDQTSSRNVKSHDAAGRSPEADRQTQTRSEPDRTGRGGHRVDLTT